MTNEVAVALVVAAGGIATAILGNWDKLFRKSSIVRAEYSGYRPTGNFETELRHYFDVSGTRETMESMQRQMLLNAKSVALTKDPEEAERINEIFAAVEKEAIKLDDVIRALMPVYQKHFTIAELQELNKFYSTEVMQSMVRKMPLLTQDAAPIQVRLQTDYYERLDAALD